MPLLLMRARSPFAPGTTTYMQVGDADGLGDGDTGGGLLGDLNLSQLMMYGGLAHGYLRGGVPAALGYALAGRLFPKAAAVLIGVQLFSKR